MGTQNPLAATVATFPVGAGFKQAPLQMDLSGNLLTGNGSANRLNLTAGATLIKASAGRTCKVIVNTAASTAGSVSDCATTGAVAAANLVFAIPQTVGVYSVDFPHLVGIVVTVGTGGVVSVSFD
jgi:hypothetical protein